MITTNERELNFMEKRRRRPNKEIEKEELISSKESTIVTLILGAILIFRSSFIAK